MLNHIIPRIALADVAPMVLVALIGGVIAGLYGTTHDQVTDTLSKDEEIEAYFAEITRCKVGNVVEVDWVENGNVRLRLVSIMPQSNTGGTKL